MPSATKVHRVPLNTTRKTESRPCWCLESRPVTEAFPVREGWSESGGSDVTAADHFSQQREWPGGHTTHERKTNKALMMTVEGLKDLYIFKPRASKRSFVCLSGSVSLASHCLTSGPGWSFPPWVQLDRKEHGREELVPRLSGMWVCQGMHGCSVLWECGWAGLFCSATVDSILTRPLQVTLRAHTVCWRLIARFTILCLM